MSKTYLGFAGYKSEMLQKAFFDKAPLASAGARAQNLKLIEGSKNNEID